MGGVRNKSQLLGAVGVVAAIVVGATLPVMLAAAAPSSHKVRPPAPVAACSPPFSAVPAPVAAASPPCQPRLTVHPATGLRDGQTVTVTGSGFASDSPVPLEECPTGATVEDQCGDNGNFSFTDDTGSFVSPVTVNRLMETDTAVVDCAGHKACEIAAMNIDTGTVEAAAPITFKNLPLPTITVVPDTALADGQTVTVTGSGFAPAAPIVLDECSNEDVGFFDCDENSDLQLTTDATGGFSTPYQVARLVTTDEYPAGEIDCAQAPGCTLDAFNEDGEELVIPPALSFDPTIAPMPPLGVSLALSGTGTIAADGSVVLSGTISCTSPAPVTVTSEVNVEQTSGTLPAQSSTEAENSCGSTPTAVTFTVPEDQAPFGAGLAEVTVELSARDGSADTDQTVTGAVTLSIPAGTPAPVYYVALGDFLVQGFGGPESPGYVEALRTDLQGSLPNLQLVNLGCTEETSVSMINGGTCDYATGANDVSQLAAAVAFLSAHRGQVALVTLDIGAEDYLACISEDPPSYDPSCIAVTGQTVSSNLKVIVSQLQAAAGSSVPLVGMNYFDPFLDYYPDGSAGKAIALTSVPVIETINTTIDNVYSVDSVPVADVQTAFQTTDLKHKVASSAGRVPVAVANTCNWLDLVCTKNGSVDEGFPEFTNATGATVIAGAFEKVLPSPLLAAAKGRH